MALIGPYATEEEAIAACSSDSDSDSDSGNTCESAESITGGGACGGSPTMTIGTWYNLDGGWAGWAVTPDTNYRFEFESHGITVSFIAAVSYCTSGTYITGGFTDSGDPSSGCVTLTTLSDSTFLHVILSGATNNCIRLVEGSC